ncbi:MAG: hypothetical protein ACREQC_08435 [Candidatus Binataceae bacterium]
MTSRSYVVTSPGDSRRELVIEAESGFGMGGAPFELHLINQFGARVAPATVSYRRAVTFALPEL